MPIHKPATVCSLFVSITPIHLFTITTGQFLISYYEKCTNMQCSLFKLQNYTTRRLYLQETAAVYTNSK